MSLHADEDDAVTTARQDRPLLGRHPVDPVSLVPGLLAVAVAVLAMVDVDVDASVVLPALLLLAGLAGLVAAVRSARR